MVKVLNITTNIYGHDKIQNLELDRENTMLEGAVAKGRYREEFEWNHVGSFEAADFRSIIQEAKPAILQIGCPTEDGELLLKHAQGMVCITGENVVNILNEDPWNIQLVVLRGPRLENVAEMILENTKAESVLYLEEDRENDKCQAFLTAFYELLANGMNVHQAFLLAELAEGKGTFRLKYRERQTPKTPLLEEKDTGIFAEVFASTPSDHSPLNGLSEEIQRIKDAAPNRKIAAGFPSDRREIIMKIACDRPSVVHFTSHANHYVIAFYNQNGEEFTLEKGWLCKVCQVFKHIVSCVVINACENYPIAFRLSEHIDYVIGTMQSIYETSGIAFSETFYRELDQQGSTVDYKAAAEAAILDTKTKYYEQGGNQFCLYERAHYGELLERMDPGERRFENRILEAKEDFLGRYGHLKEAYIQNFRGTFESWFGQFEDDEEMQKLVVKFLREFVYYSKEDVSAIMNYMLCKVVRDFRLPIGYTVFSALPSQKRRYNSSFEYLVNAKRELGLEKFHVQTDLEMRVDEITDYSQAGTPQLAEQFKDAQCFIFLDDMLGSGQTFVDYIRARKEMFAGKHLIYVVIHAMEAGVKSIVKEAKRTGIDVTVCAFGTYKKAFESEKNVKEKRRKFAAACRELGIEEKYIFGYGNAEALCAFYNNIPNNTFGIFARDGGAFSSLFYRERAKDDRGYLANVKFKNDVEEAILDYTQRCPGIPDFAALAVLLERPLEEVNDKVRSMLEKGTLVCQGSDIRPANKRRIVVLGGSFNPPTSMHRTLLYNAVQELKADYGIFVPSSDAYVRRKMEKNQEFVSPLSEEKRVAMLRTFTEDYPQLLVSRCELGDDGRGHTYDSMCSLQYENPNAELIFLMGADKLENFTKWPTRDAFLKAFRIAVTGREDLDPEPILEENEYLKTVKERFILLQTRAGDPEVSSSKVRKAILRGEETGDMLSEKIKKILKEEPEAITFFRGDYFFLSNFYPTEVYYDGICYQNAEAAFQAQKCITREERETFADLEPKEAKEKGRKVVLRENWDERKVDIMQAIVKAKFDQNVQIREKLKKTGAAFLVEGNDWEDTFWGISFETGQGENMLGRILMLVRSMYLLRL